MSAQGPGWLDEPEHDEPVELAHAIDDWASTQLLPTAEEPEPAEYDPGPEVDDEGGMSEYRHYADWQDVDRAEYEREASE